MNADQFDYVMIILIILPGVFGIIGFIVGYYMGYTVWERHNER